jgi:hypothetical protein
MSQTGPISVPKQPYGSTIHMRGASLAPSTNREAFLQDQRQNGAARPERHDAADLTRRYGEIGISAVAAALISRARNSNEQNTSDWMAERRYDAA